MIEREWVSIRDPDDDHTRYTFDTSFLLSRYHCIYGMGCQGIRDEGPDTTVGCCEHGAYYTEAEERAAVEATIDLLGPELMQFHDEAIRGGVTEVDAEDEAKTRTVDGGCIFLNREGFPAGKGCALHLLAMERGEHHMTHKPTVCWQLPLHRHIDEEVANDGGKLEVHRIEAYERGTWGDGGANFHWWCTEDPAAFTSKKPVYVTMEFELREMVGDAVYEQLRVYLDGRVRQRSRVQFLPLAT